ncbi:hypothetical protein ACEPPN_001182 [Leptodophora sp. 'Broadleaf-Isolate-01']
MSNKITDARIRELERLQSLKSDLKEKIEAEQDGMQKILDSMNEEAQEPKDARGKGSSSLYHQDVIEAHRMAIERLEEQFSEVMRELEQLEELMKLT